MKTILNDIFPHHQLINKKLKQPGRINNYFSCFKFPVREDTFDAFFVHFSIHL